MATEAESRWIHRAAVTAIYNRNAETGGEGGISSTPSRASRGETGELSLRFFFVADLRA